jgi:hypothetical protein
LQGTKEIDFKTEEEEGQLENFVRVSTSLIPIGQSRSSLPTPNERL